MKWQFANISIHKKSEPANLQTKILAKLLQKSPFAKINPREKESKNENFLDISITTTMSARHFGIGLFYIFMFICYYANLHLSFKYSLKKNCDALMLF